MGKGKTDWLLYVLMIGLLITIIVFSATSGILGPQLNMTIKTNPDGTITITLTGISEIIVALALAVGIFIRLIRKKS